MSTTINGLPVISAARKLVAVVPQTTRVVNFPDGANVSKYGKENSKPAIVVQNRTDGGSWQGAGVGHYVIVNEVGEDAATQFLTNLGTDYDVIKLESELAKLAEAGFGDQYTTDLSFVQSKLSPAGQCNGLTTNDGKIVTLAAGIVKRDDRDVCHVFRDSGDVLQIVIKEPRRIEADILTRTYRKVDGSAIVLDEIPTVS